MDRTIRAKLKLEKETGMKKILSLLLIISMMMLAAGCANRGKTETDAKTDTETYTDLIFDTTFVHTIDVTMSEEEAGRVYDLIFPYIEKDPKAYFTPDRSKKARETLIKFSELRAESVRRQLSGLLAAKTELQNEEDRVDASGITITDMGTIEDLK